MPHCSFAALSKNIAAAAIARPARTTGVYAGIGRENRVLRRVFRPPAQRGVREPIIENDYQVRQLLLVVLHETVKKIICNSTRNSKFKRLGPPFQLSSTKSASKEGRETAVASPHSRECTKEPISILPNYGSNEKFGARAELRMSFRLPGIIER